MSRTADVADVAGVARFARYASPPNQRGYCGPDHFGRLGATPANDDVEALRRSAREFIGAYPYLEVLAGAAGEPDPLAAPVVEAYWIGNDVLRRVATGDFGNSVSDRFRRRSGRAWEHLELSVPGAFCNHAYHVFVVSPWVGLMRDGVIDEPLSIVDQCRVSWGTVRAVGPAPGHAVAERTALTWVDGRLVPGATELVDVLCDIPVDVGDVVSLHWGYVCDVLAPTQLGWLRHVTHTQLALASRIGRPY